MSDPDMDEPECDDEVDELNEAAECEGCDDCQPDDYVSDDDL